MIIALGSLYSPICLVLDITRPPGGVQMRENREPAYDFNLMVGQGFLDKFRRSDGKEKETVRAQPCRGGLVPWEIRRLPYR